MTINIFVLKGDLNGKIVVVHFIFCRVYNKFNLILLMVYYRHIASFESWISKVQDLENIWLLPM